MGAGAGVTGGGGEGGGGKEWEEKGRGGERQGPVWDPGRLINANEPVAAAAAAGRWRRRRRSRVTHWLPGTPRAAILLRGKEEEEEGTGAKGGTGRSGAARQFPTRQEEAKVAESLLLPFLCRPAFQPRFRAAGWRAGRRRQGGGRVKWRRRRLGARPGKGGKRLSLPSPLPPALFPPPVAGNLRQERAHAAAVTAPGERLLLATPSRGAWSRAPAALAGLPRGPPA